jgi:hypothetical protein
MILTLHSIDKTYHITITADQFKQLRNPKTTMEELTNIASDCEVDVAVLVEYVEDLKKTVQEMIELDGSCDYSDQL